MIGGGDTPPRQIITGGTRPFGLPGCRPGPGSPPPSRPRGLMTLRAGLPAPLAALTGDGGEWTARPDQDAMSTLPDNGRGRRNDPPASPPPTGGGGLAAGRPAALRVQVAEEANQRFA